MQKNQSKLLATKALQQITGGITKMPIMHMQDVGSRSIVGTTVNNPTPLRNLNDTQGQI